MDERIFKKGKIQVIDKLKLVIGLGLEKEFFLSPSFSYKKRDEEFASILKSRCIERYLSRKEIIDDIKTPSRYMMVSSDTYCHLNKEYLLDIDLILALIGRVSEGLYIPNRDIDLEGFSFSFDRVFFKEEEDE